MVNRTAYYSFVLSHFQMPRSHWSNVLEMWKPSSSQEKTEISDPRLVKIHFWRIFVQCVSSIYVLLDVVLEAMIYSRSLVGLVPALRWLRRLRREVAVPLHCVGALQVPNSNQPILISFKWMDGSFLLSLR